MNQQRGVSAGSPGAPHGGRQHEATLVQEGQVRPQALDFFLIATH
jgi:hypothetical protein